MKELIKIEKQVIGKEEINSVDARELWKFVGSKQKFTDWIKKRIKDYNFKENQDFFTFHKKKKRKEGYRGTTNTKEYIISLDMAKEISMIEKTKIGKQARQYFIACEKELKKRYTEPDLSMRPPITDEVVKVLRSHIEAAELLGLKKEHSIFAINQIVFERTKVDCLTELGNPEIRSEDKNYYLIPTGIGRNVGLKAHEVNLELEKMGLQYRVRSSRTGRNVWVLTEEGKKYAILNYRRKKGCYSDQPISQIKWSHTVLEKFKTRTNLIAL